MPATSPATCGRCSPELTAHWSFLHLRSPVQHREPPGGSIPDISSLARDLHAITYDSADVDDLRGQFGRTADLVAYIVPSFCDLALSVTVDDVTVTVTTMTDDASIPAPVCSSLLLPACEQPAKGHLLLFAFTAHAFDQLAAELTAAADARGLPRPELDQHLDTRPHTTAVDSVADISAVHQALGALLDKGWLPDDGRRELARRAAINSSSLSGEARLVLLDLIDRDIDRDDGLDPPA